MGTVAKRAEREQISKQCKKILQHGTRHLSTGKFDVQINPKNIGTGSVDYWLWIMDQDLRVVFGQKNGGMIFFFFWWGGGGSKITKLTHIFFFHLYLIFLQVVLLIVNSLKTTKTLIRS